MQRIGIFGGTFDPVHFGHLRTALEIMEQAQLDNVRLVPCARPPHREAPVATVPQRVAMLELATRGVDGFSIDQREVRRPGQSYTVDTLTSLRTELGQVVLCLVIGMDALETFHRWHRWQQILELAHLIVAQRPGAQRPRRQPLAGLLAERLLEDSTQLGERMAGRILFQPVTQLEISATVLRQAIALGRSAAFLTPEPVWRYIERNGLYLGAERA